MSETIKLPPDLLLRDRAERAEAERDALRADAERYRWLRTARDWGFWCCHGKDGEGGQILKYGADLDAAIDAALEKDKSVTAPPIWETLAEIGESAPAGTWDVLPAQLTDKEARELWVLFQLRVALGDPTGELMQDELVERARNAWADAQLYRMQRAPLDDAQALALARQHLDKGLSWAPHIVRCTDLEVRALIRAVEAAHGIGA